MKAWTITGKAIVCVLALGCAHATGDGASKAGCPDSSESLICVQENFDRMYSAHYDSFWKILHASAARARECRDIPFTVRFLGLARLRSANAEFNEFLSKEIEDLALNNAECFLRALSRSDANVTAAIGGRLRQPLFVERAGIVRAMQRFEAGSYGELIRGLIQNPE